MNECSVKSMSFYCRLKDESGKKGWVVWHVDCKNESTSEAIKKLESITGLSVIEIRLKGMEWDSKPNSNIILGAGYVQKIGREIKGVSTRGSSL